MTQKARVTSGSFFITDVLALAASRSVRTSRFPNVTCSRLLGGTALAPKGLSAPRSGPAADGTAMYDPVGRSLNAS
ncbi:hypothetical protein GCM10009548_37040 [Streptomyces malaysiensis subsp. malaysiensis]